ncbi:MAG: phage tail assembly protein [Geobacter sp.]|nr:phage tail assembly protein [Geobacter sp.]
MKVTKIESVKPSLKIEEVEIRQPLVDDLLKAERIAGKADGLAFMLALLSQVGTFDGKALPPEELERLSSKDFLTLSDEVDLRDVPATLPSGSSISPEKASSGKSA